MGHTCSLSRSTLTGASKMSRYSATVGASWISAGARRVGEGVEGGRGKAARVEGGAHD